MKMFRSCITPFIATSISSNSLKISDRAVRNKQKISIIHLKRAENSGGKRLTDMHVTEVLKNDISTDTNLF